MGNRTKKELNRAQASKSKATQVGKRGAHVASGGLVGQKQRELGQGPRGGFAVKAG
jgi:hypothetical protein